MWVNCLSFLRLSPGAEVLGSASSVNLRLCLCAFILLCSDDFKSGQTKFKSVLVDFLVSAGIKPTSIGKPTLLTCPFPMIRCYLYSFPSLPTSIVSYNHLGNNDGKNLSAPQQFRSKEISKSNVVDDMVDSNAMMYGPGEHPDHVVVIKYVPSVGDSKRALDEYSSRIFMGGTSTIVVHNTCEDSLLAAPLMIDLIVIAELCERITLRRASEPQSAAAHFHSVLSLLSYMLKAPLVPVGTPVINSLFKQVGAFVLLPAMHLPVLPLVLCNAPFPLFYSAKPL